MVVGRAAFSLVEEGTWTWERDSPSSLRRDHKHLIRRHCGVKVIGGGFQGVDSAYGEVIDKSSDDRETAHDDFDCMCYRIKEGLGCFSNRCVNALVDADHEQRRQPLQTPGEHVIPPDDQFSDPSSKRSNIVTESVCSVEGFVPEPAASSTVAVANKSSQGLCFIIISVTRNNTNVLMTS